MTTRDYPLGLRRAALHSLEQFGDGGQHLLELARTGKLPEDLKNEAAMLVYSSRDRSVRERARSILPLPKTASGRTLPSFFELVRREGNSARGQAVFFRAGNNSCSSCHRVQGRGQWVGPDLSTIGVKYGRDELLRSMLSPSAAIGYSFRALVVALVDGRVITGLPVDETAERLVLKTADGQRISIDPQTIEDRRTSDVSLMPEGLAQTMTDQELVDLLAYLTTLKQPVSIVGQYQVAGPVYEPNGRQSTVWISKLDLHGPLDDGRGKKLTWRRLSANAEGLADFGPLTAGEPNHALYAWLPVFSPARQRATLVWDGGAEITAWLDGKPLSLERGPERQAPVSSVVELPPGKSTLLVRLVPGAGGKEASLVTTVVSDRPVSFTSDEPLRATRAADRN